MSRQMMREEIVDAARNVPRLSPGTVQLLQLTSSDDYDIQEVIDLVRHDSALTPQVLKVANSVALSGVAQINSIDRAVLYLGARMVVALALTGVVDRFRSRELKDWNPEVGDLWRHDLRTAIASRKVARAVDLEMNVDMAFTAGLLHDFGKAVITDYLLDRSPDLVERIRQHFLADFPEVERELLGIDHCRVGHIVAQAWGLPGSLEMSMLHHHDPAGASKAYQPLVYMVHIGDVLAMLSEAGNGEDGLYSHLENGYLRFLRLDDEELARIKLCSEEEFGRVSTALQGN